MAGRVIRALPLRTFEFTNVGSGKTMISTVVRKLDVSGAREGDLLVRLHSATIPAFPARLTVRALQDLSTDLDPATEFIGDSVAEVSFEADDSAGSVRVAALDDGRLGTYLSIVIEAKQRTEGDTFTAQMSAEIVLR